LASQTSSAAAAALKSAAAEHGARHDRPEPVDLARGGTVILHL
jgi:hypothetical protein